ncbi:hypothetical protein I0C86_13300 [Plantactinospora sp. S1510]|uniref:Uncharacterized protein n=1 Tax=Plantactinospora alkalitolerans TaxID=2789879 RepID=A0ABS0GV34_9ACTN|nr:hypothetical protein [Plantactinospora alkalitolerans]
MLSALALLRELRAELENWEPRLIAAARQRGPAWTGCTTPWADPTPPPWSGRCPTPNRICRPTTRHSPNASTR